jgi:hypothetical protein
MNPGILLLAKLMARQAVKVHLRGNPQSDQELSIKRSNRVVPPQLKKD